MKHCLVVVPHTVVDSQSLQVLQWARKLFSHNLSSDSDLKPSKKLKNGLAGKFPQDLGHCQNLGPILWFYRVRALVILSIYSMIMPQGLHHALRNRSMPFLLMNYPWGHISCQPLVVRINKSPQPINETLNNFFWTCIKYLSCTFLSLCKSALCVLLVVIFTPPPVLNESLY